MQKQKMKIAIIAMIAVGMTITSLQAHAAKNWKDYFDRNEESAIKKLADSYVRDQIDDKSKNWKGIISAKSVDDSISKRKIYTGTMPTDASGADKSSVDGITTTYFKKISASEINVSENPQVSLYVKDTSFPTISSNLWKVNSNRIYFEDGAIWILYGIDENGWTQQVGEYKVVVNY